MSGRQSTDEQMPEKVLEESTPVPRYIYPWMRGGDALLSQSPRILPPMLRRVYAKHMTARRRGR